MFTALRSASQRNQLKCYFFRWPPPCLWLMDVRLAGCNIQWSARSRSPTWAASQPSLRADTSLAQSDRTTLRHHSCNPTTRTSSQTKHRPMRVASVSEGSATVEMTAFPGPLRSPADRCVALFTLLLNLEWQCPISDRITFVWTVCHSQMQFLIRLIYWYYIIHSY